MSNSTTQSQLGKADKDVERHNSIKANKGAVEIQAAVPKYTRSDSVTESKRFGSTDQQLAKQLD